MFISLLFFTTLTIVSTNDESLFSLACSYVDKTCSLYKIDIDQLNERAVSNVIATWNQKNVTDSFGSMGGFKDGNMQYIVMTTDCDSHGFLINITNLSQSPSSITMKTSCTQSIHSLDDRYLLALGTTPNNMGGSSPVSLYAFNGMSGYLDRGKFLIIFFIEVNSNLSFT